MAFITKELAIRIKEKLNAQVEKRPGKRHDMARIYEGGRLIASFGIRRGSNKNLGHDHIPDSIFVGPHFTKDIGVCNKNREDWIRALAQKGMI